MPLFHVRVAVPGVSVAVIGKCWPVIRDGMLSTDRESSGESASRTVSAQDLDMAGLSCDWA